MKNNLNKTLERITPKIAREIENIIEICAFDYIRVNIAQEEQEAILNVFEDIIEIVKNKSWKLQVVDDENGWTNTGKNNKDLNK